MLLIVSAFILGGYLAGLVAEDTKTNSCYCRLISLLKTASNCCVEVKVGRFNGLLLYFCSYKSHLVLCCFPWLAVFLCGQSYIYLKCLCTSLLYGFVLAICSRQKKQPLEPFLCFGNQTDLYDVYFTCKTVVINRNCENVSVSKNKHVCLLNHNLTRNL